MLGTRLFISNLDPEVNDADLEVFFAEAGQVLNINIINDRDTGKSRGFAFVDFKSFEDAAQAIRLLDGKELVGRRVQVQEARERTRK